ncbi:LarC family nickel insertion protein [Anaerococcus sp. mt242]|uniref:LarC family nickel insertion protein n=1 Tax=Anaerococcus sp. mt242 TaxID=2661917 RepID=UPI00193480E8|nr:LarC family nickel insertion protein [Anaerococcus sp. mt242]MBM0046735.1 LarC family nickel insertion protein [Anaerococcus sp. mt242]
MDLYFEMNSGIAGDMTIAALLDLGASKEKLVNAIESLGIDGYELVFDRKIKNNIDANNFDVILTNQDHDHHHEQVKDDHNHSHEHKDEDGKTFTHTHDHGHSHEHTHEHVDENGNTYTHSHSEDHHGHRHLKEITELINKADISERAKKDALGIFDIIADAEAKAHGIDKSAVHFHEVGAVDSIIDIIGTAVLIDDLNVENIYFSDLSEGYGYQYSSHGQMPIPVPAVINILAGSDINLKLLDEEGEHVTPTGAAIVRYYDKGEKVESFKVKNVGLGAGNKDFAKYTNILRVMEIETSKKKH